MTTWLARVLRWCRHLLQGFWYWLTCRTLQRQRRRLCGPTPPPRFRMQPKPKWVRNEVITLKAVLPQVGCRTVAHHFNRRWATRKHMTMSKTYVAETCRKYQYAIYEARRKMKHRILRPMSRNRIWACDLLTKTDQHGRAHLALAIVDHASRACLRLQGLPDKSSWRLLQELVQMMKRYGRPQFLRTDNEAVFTSGWFTWGLQLLGIRHQRTEPGCPGRTGGWNGSSGQSRPHSANSL